MVNIDENNTEEKKQRKRIKKNWYSKRQVKKNIFKKEEVINLSSGTNLLGKMSTEDLLWDLTQRMLLVTDNNDHRG